MTREDAIAVVAMIVNTWPGSVWTAEQMEVYVDAIVSYDAALMTKAVARAANALKYRPSIAELREFLAIERRSQLTPSQEADLVPPEMPNKPIWVKRWEIARSRGDRRIFPEQMHAMDMMSRESQGHFKAYRPPEALISDAEVFVQPYEYLEDVAD